MVSAPVSTHQDNTSLYSFPSQKLAEKEIEQKAFQQQLTKEPYTKPHLPAKTNRVLQQAKQENSAPNKPADYLNGNLTAKTIVSNVMQINETTGFYNMLNNKLSC